jgi:hypothetical protein
MSKGALIRGTITSEGRMKHGFCGNCTMEGIPARWLRHVPSGPIGRPAHTLRRSNGFQARREAGDLDAENRE